MRAASGGGVGEVKAGWGRGSGFVGETCCCERTLSVGLKVVLMEGGRGLSRTREEEAAERGLRGGWEGGRGRLPSAEALRRASGIAGCGRLWDGGVGEQARAKRGLADAGRSMVGFQELAPVGRVVEPVEEEDLLDTRGVESSPPTHTMP